MSVHSQTVKTGSKDTSLRKDSQQSLDRMTGMPYKMSCINWHSSSFEQADILASIRSQKKESQRRCGNSKYIKAINQSNNSEVKLIVLIVHQQEKISVFCSKL